MKFRGGENTVKYLKYFDVFVFCITLTFIFIKSICFYILIIMNYLWLTLREKLFDFCTLRVFLDVEIHAYSCSVKCFCETGSYYIHSVPEGEGSSLERMYLLAEEQSHSVLLSVQFFFLSVLFWAVFFCLFV